MLSSKPLKMLKKIQSEMFETENFSTEFLQLFFVLTVLQFFLSS